MAMNAELYKQMEAAFKDCKIDQPVEDIMLELAEMIAEEYQPGQQGSIKVKYGKTMISAMGKLDRDEESVYLLTLSIGKRIFEIDDYL